MQTEAEAMSPGGTGSSRVPPVACCTLSQHCSLEHFLDVMEMVASVDEDCPVIAAAKRMHALPLPSGWTVEKDDGTECMYFFNSVTEESMWLHPQEKLFREIFEEVKSWPRKETTQCLAEKVQGHLQKAHRQAVDFLDDWVSVRPADHDQFQYFVNRSTGDSEWQDPREFCEFELQQRQAVFWESLRAHDQRLRKTAAEGSCFALPSSRPSSAMSLLPTPCRGKRRSLPPCLPKEEQSSEVTDFLTELETAEREGLLSARFRLEPIKPASPGSTASFSMSRYGPSCAGGSSSPSDKMSTCSGSTAQTPINAFSSRRGLPRIVLNGVELERVPMPAPSIVRRPPTTPCRWLAHARFVNSQARAENDELQLLILQLRRNLEKTEELQRSGIKDSKEFLEQQEALRAEQAAIRSRSRYCLHRSTTVLQNPAEQTSPHPPATVPPARMTPKAAGLCW